STTYDASELHCANCKGHHSSTYKGCPAYAKAKQICFLKATNNISYAEAAKRYNQGSKAMEQIVSEGSGNIPIQHVGVLAQAAALPLASRTISATSTPSRIHRRNMAPNASTRFFQHSLQAAQTETTMADNFYLHTHRWPPMDTISIPGDHLISKEIHLGDTPVNSLAKNIPVSTNPVSDI